ncbi:BrnT family toxin [Enterovirga rhinocerotis]|uniref:Uncharacterized protein n=1 Tax=Enterovirga rhinocerotis TaxID=1339210 RepID=A0A4V3DX46_9HYPH|nr:BrnT family toxin [Enterovirga rhinocerotis]TDR87329.1 hypothetical protein EV668_4410 [Enterovirga rhinocerotis]
MIFVIDEPKRLANLARHHIDQNDVATDFDFDAALIVPTYPSRVTGRVRIMAIGPMAAHGIVVVVFSPLGSEAIGLVSVRPASTKERALYEQR